MKNKEVTFVIQKIDEDTPYWHDVENIYKEDEFEAADALFGYRSREAEQFKLKQKYRLIKRTEELLKDE
jgi:hypothetical protein